MVHAMRSPNLFAPRLAPHQRSCRAAALFAICSLASTGDVSAQQLIGAAGANAFGQCGPPPVPSGTEIVKISAGADHNVAILNDGSAIGWGSNSWGKSTVPPPPPGLSYVQAATAVDTSLLLLSDGSIVAVGGGPSGLGSVPAPPPGATFLEVAAGTYHALLRASDGSVVAYGGNAHGQCNVPALPAGVTYVRVAAGTDESAAVRSDGTVVTWGNFATYYSPPLPPAGQSFVDVVTGATHWVARTSTGAIVVWGQGGWGQLSVPPVPPGLSCVQISAGGYHTLALLSNGAVLVWGQYTSGQLMLPPLPPGIVCAEVAAGHVHSIVRCGPAAWVVSNGVGCGGAGTPTFVSGPPRLGYPVQMSLTQGTPSASGYLFIGAAAAPPFGLGGGCYLQIDLNTVVPLLPVATDAGGAWSTNLQLSNDPVFLGFQFAMQIALFSTQSPLGFDLSNGQYVSIGF
jgi:hypothetical protein